MRAHRTTALLAATSTALLLAAPAPASSRGVERIRVLDDCEQVTFDANVGPGTCVGDGDVTFEEFVDELADGGHGHWKFSPDDTHIRRGEVLHLESRGGEVHTFNEVDEYGAGCVPFINEALGLEGPPVMDCATAFDADAFVPPGGELTVGGLGVGTHLFECAIHPWMQTTVVVRRR